MRKKLSSCPSDYCIAGNPAQDVIRHTMAANAGQPNLEGSYRCIHCQTGWKYSADGSAKVILGYFDDDLGWVPRS